MNCTVSVYNSSFHCLGSIWRQFTWNHPRNRCVLTFLGDMFSMQPVTILSVSVRESTALLGRVGPLLFGQMPDLTKITERCFLPPQICNKTDWSLKQILAIPKAPIIAYLLEDERYIWVDFMTRVLSGDEGIGPGSRVSVLSMTKAQDDKYLVSYDWPNSWKHGVTKYSQCDTTRNSWLVNSLLPLLCADLNASWSKTRKSV